MTTAAPAAPDSAAPRAAAAPASAGSEVALGPYHTISTKDALAAFSGKAVAGYRAFDRRMPAEAFDPAKSGMSKENWEQWLRWTTGSGVFKDR